MYQFQCKDRKYNDWDVKCFADKETFTHSLDPIQCRLFNDDVFQLDHSNGIPHILGSPVREKPFLAGVLVLKGNKTYGRRKNQVTLKPDKLLYKCVPNDSLLPSFLVPYEIKHMGFSKMFTNLYVTFKYDHWEEKHPYGTLLQVIGPVDELPHFYEYQLYCKNLHTSMNRFEKETIKRIQQMGVSSSESNGLFHQMKEKYPHLEDRRNGYQVFTIDPEGSVDFDDGFSLRYLAEDSNKGFDIQNTGKWLLSIYISNVPLLIDTLDLWEYFTDRISTIYLPDKKRSMLPSILSDHLCSLREKTTRVTFVMDVYIDYVEKEKDSSISITKIEYKHALVNIYKNYVYEESKLTKDFHYQTLLTITKKFLPLYPYLPCIQDSHDVVAYWMIFMNHHCALEMVSFQKGIFRSANSHQQSTFNTGFIKGSSLNKSCDLPEEIARELILWQGVSGKYVEANNTQGEKKSLKHDLLGVDVYLHITSPIRRLVDLLNMIQIQQIENLVIWSLKVQEFYEKWIHNLDRINEKTKEIRKIQNQSNLLHLCSKDSSMLEKTFSGYLFNRREKSGETLLYMYDLFVPELKIVSKIVTEKGLKEYEKCFCRCYLFQDEENYKRKIRWSLL